jgi:hypothetical protein
MPERKKTNPWPNVWVQTVVLVATQGSPRALKLGNPDDDIAAVNGDGKTLVMNAVSPGAPLPEP